MTKSFPLIPKTEQGTDPGNLQDSYRLPEGMKRIGYDADSGRYYFRDRDGSTWVGEEGVEVGEMTRGSSLSLKR